MKNIYEWFVVNYKWFILFLFISVVLSMFFTGLLSFLVTSGLVGE